MALIPPSGRDQRKTRKWIRAGKQSCVSFSVRGVGSKEISRVQCHLTSLELGLQAAAGLLCYLVIGKCMCASGVGFQRRTGV